MDWDGMDEAGRWGGVSLLGVAGIGQGKRVER